jgi:HK97 gp10 family phage protein
MDVTFDIKGLDELEKNIKRLIKHTDKAIGPALMHGGAIIEGRIREYAPGGKTLRLKSAVYSNLSPEGKAVFVGVRQWKNKAPHAHLVEKGHGGIHPAPPHPFMKPALDASKQEALTTIKEDLTTAIEGAF